MGLKLLVPRHANELSVAVCEHQPDHLALFEFGKPLRIPQEPLQNPLETRAQRFMPHKLLPLRFPVALFKPEHSENLQVRLKTLQQN